MRNFSLLLLIITIMLASCSLFNPDFGEISAEFIEGGSQRNISTKSMTNQTEEISGMCFGELEIVAYQYSPGFASNSGVSGGFASGVDWAHYIVLQSGHPAARDIFLESGGIVDIAALNDTYDFSLEDDFAANFDSFSIDFFEVCVFRSGIVIDDKYFGMSAKLSESQEHPLHNYPELTDIPTYYRETNISGFPSSNQSFSVFFSRSDWFPEPALVTLSEDEDGVFHFLSSNINLTDTQKEYLESLATNGTYRRFYGNLVIVPYDGPVKFAVTGDGEGMENPVAQVKFNFDNLLSDETYEDFADDQFIDADTIYYKLVNDIPFGLSIDFIEASVQ